MEGQFDGDGVFVSLLTLGSLVQCGVAFSSLLLNLLVIFRQPTGSTAAEAEVKYQLAIRTLQTRVELATHLWSLPCIWLRELWSLGTAGFALNFLRARY